MIACKKCTKFLVITLLAIFLIACGSKKNIHEGGQMNNHISQLVPAKITNNFGKTSINEQVITSPLSLEAKNILRTDKDAWVDIQITTGLENNDFLRLKSGKANANFAILRPSVDVGGISESMREAVGMESNEDVVNYNELMVSLQSGLLYISTAKRDIARKEILKLSTDNVSITNAFDANFTLEKNDNGTVLSVHKGEVNFSIVNQGGSEVVNAHSSVKITSTLDVEDIVYQPSENEVPFFK